MEAKLSIYAKLIYGYIMKYFQFNFRADFKSEEIKSLKL
jgi:hypothetical protein